MFSIVIAVGPASDKISLLYKTIDTANAALNLLRATNLSPLIQMEDDFGQITIIRVNEMHAVIFEDMSLSSESRIEQGLHLARIQAKYQARLQSDPALKVAGMVGQQFVGQQFNAMPHGHS